MHMAMAWIWTGMAAVSLIFAAWNLSLIHI